MEDSLYSAKQVAEIISHTKNDSEITQLIRKIRHWSANDVLIPIGGKNTGTGISRKYDPLQVRIAAIIYELTRYGITVEMLGSSFNEWIADAICHSTEWAKAINNEQDYILSLSWSGTQESTFAPIRENGLLSISTEYQERANATYPSAILINLRTIFKSVRL